jgi:hypothetical protein
MQSRARPWQRVLVGAITLAVTTFGSPALGPALGYQPVASVEAADAPATLEAALRAVVQRANEAQQQAFAQGDAAPMRELATDDYFAELVQTNRQLAASGVAAIELLNIEWGPTALDGATAQLTTLETWRTRYADGTTEDGRDRNVYTLVRQAGAWRIQADVHPDRPRPARPPRACRRRSRCRSGVDSHATGPATRPPAASSRPSAGPGPCPRLRPARPPSAAAPPGSASAACAAVT